MPRVDAQGLPQVLDVTDQVVRPVVLQLSGRPGTTRTPLVEQHGPEVRGIEELPVDQGAARARAAVHEEHWLAIGLAALSNILSGSDNIAIGIDSLRGNLIGNANKFSPTPYMEMNPDAAARLGIQHGSYARLTSRRSDAVVLVQCTQRVPRDMVFIPFHYHECVNRLTLGLLDPHSRQPAYKQCAVRIEAIADQGAAAARNRSARAF